MTLHCTIKNLNVQRNNRQILRNISLQLDSQGCTAILGANGAGKTALFRIMLGLQKPTSGSITWGRDAAQSPTNHAYVPAGAKPFQRSVIGNVTLALHLKGWRGQTMKQRALQALQQCQLTDLAQQPANSLSSGETQKLFLACAWAIQAKTIFLDEPTANLDPNNSREIESLMQNLADGGCKLVLITHNIAQARRLADQVIFMEQGRTFPQMTFNEFMNHEDQAIKFYLNEQR